ncbi:MAG: FAD-binding oxidoreductase, partial [Rubellimicrobium sp.]|nr:FAD-binding oxidoreductase [Rubellimicrobium sp.]
GKIAADRVILTAGTGSPALLGRLGIDLPLLPRPGVLIRTRPVAPILRGVLCGPEGEARQLASGAVILPAAVSHQGDAAERLDERPDRLAEAALGRFGRRFAGLPLTADRIAIGWRPVPVDGLPVLDEVLPGLCMAVMHSGVTLGPLAGEALAELVEGRDPGPHWAPYRLTRLSAPRPA